MIIDTHVHVASPDVTRYPRAPRGVGSDWWRTGDRGASTLVEALDRAGVERAVVVQAVGPYGYDCRCAIDAVASRPDRLRLVVAVDPDDPAPAATLERIVSAAPVSGVRVFCVGGAQTAWLTDGRAEGVWRAAGAMGITVVPTVFPTEIAAVGRLVEAHPSVAVALDHAGFPDLPLAADAPVLRLAELPAVHLKVSSHLLEAVADPGDLVRRLFGAFGADRLCWGSDYPQTSQDYPALVALGETAAAALGAVDRDAFLAGTAARLWP